MEVQKVGKNFSGDVDCCWFKLMIDMRGEKVGKDFLGQMETCSVL